MTLMYDKKFSVIYAKYKLLCTHCIRMRCCSLLKSAGGQIGLHCWNVLYLCHIETLKAPSQILMFIVIA